MPAKRPPTHGHEGKLIRIESQLDEAALVLGEKGPLALAEGGDGEERFEPISIRAYDGKPFRQWWSPEPLVIDLEGFRPAQRHVLLVSHIKDPAYVLGHAESTTVEGGYVWVKGVASGAGNEEVDRVLTLMRRRVPFQASLGASIDRYEIVKAGEKAKVNGAEHAGPLMVVRASTHRETSLVLLGAAADTETKIAAQAAEGHAMNPDDITATDGAGQPATAAPPAPAAKVEASAQPAAPTAPQAPGADPMRDHRLRIAAEYERVGAIEAACKGVECSARGAIVAQAIRENWSAQQAKDACELAMHREGRGRPGAPSIIVGHGRQSGTPKVAEAALCLAMGLSADILAKDTAYGAPCVEAAQAELRHGGGSINQLVLEAALASGQCDARRITAANAVRVIEAALTSHTLTSLLGNVANKLVADSFETGDTAWAEFCGIQSLNNFQSHTICRLVGGMEYQPLAPGGQVTHATIAEGTGSLKASTKAILVVLSNEDIVNDDTGKLMSFLASLGTGADLAINRAVYTALLGNASSFFSAGNANYLSGSTTALDVSSLGTAVAAIRNMKDEAGNFIVTRGQVLLVNPALEMVAHQLYKSEILEGSTAKSANRNIWAGQFKPVVTPWIGPSASTNGTALGGTATLWFLLGRSGATGVVNVGFINGQRAPRVEQVTLPADRMGIGFLGSHAFGVALGEKKLGVMSKGAA